ncbi:leucine-rich repeat domain-containing protein [Flavobacterium sp.]|uniref:DUF7619 domain-containing protein n=1 Tax=Flavobacterium sp. TaxID=239 RepID=UPI00262E0692|nr:leucine-rich repeat domain-containing protein [Flavobacterium sp.]
MNTLYNTDNMKKTLWLLLMFTGMVNAQPVINTPTPYQVCDDNTNGIAAFDINVKTPTIITQAGTLVSYHRTSEDAQAGINSIDLAEPFTNTTPFNQTIYIRAWDVADPGLPSFTTLSLIVSQKPSVSMFNNTNCVGFDITVTTTASPPGLYNYFYTTPVGFTNPGSVTSFNTNVEGYYSVIATDAASGCVSSQAAVYVSFIPSPVVTVNATSICDGNPAIVSTSVSSGNSLTYVWTNFPAAAIDPGNVGSFSTLAAGSYSVVAIDGGTGCTSNTVSVEVFNQTSVTPTFSIPPSVCAGFELPTTSDDGFAGTWSPTLDTTGTYIFTPSVGQCASTYSTLITVISGINANQAPDLVQNSATNNAVFDLTSQNSIINSDTNVQFTFFASLAEAESNSNPIGNPTTYVNTSSPQTIGIRVFDPASPNCANITSFKLIINNPNNVYIPDANFKARIIAFGVDTNFDNEIQVTEAAAYSGELNVSYALIANLTGIEAFTNLTVLRCNNNNLSSFSVNGLTSLTYLDCSYNQLTTLNLVNFPNLKFLYCSNNLLTALDITAFPQLEELNCSLNQLTSLNVAPLSILKKLVCNFNSIHTLSLNDLPNFEYLEYEYNQSTSITFSNVPNMKYLDCSLNFYITNLDLSALPLLEHLDCRYNSLSALNMTGLSSLNYLDCSVNQFTTIDISGLNNLATFYAYNNYFATIDLTNHPSLLSVSIDNNQLTTLDFTGSNNVTSISCNNNLLTSLNISGLISLNSLYCQYNQLSAIDFTGLKGLTYLLCDHNLLTSLDFSTAINLRALSCSYNNLSSINIKNGNPYIDTNSYYNWSQNPILTFICTDEAKLTAIGLILSQSTNVNNGNVVFNTYCSFVPGGYYNSITGQIKLDANNNGCDSNDLPKQFIKVKINDGGNQGATFTDAEGNYNFYTTAGNLNITPETENPTWFNFSPPIATFSFPSIDQSINTQNFCIVPNGSHQDLEVVIEPIDIAIPGDNATYKMVYRNKGNLTVSGNVTFNYDDALLDFVSATLAPNAQNTGVLNWNYTDLLPFESRSFYVTLHVNSPAASVGTILDFSASLNPVAIDENPADNQFTYHETVAALVDPNSITCIEGTAVAPVEIGNYLHYVVNFENTGTYLAQNVVIRIEIDTTKYDINSVQLLSASHHCYTRIAGNIVEFIFEGIDLDAKSGNPPVGGHGDILFKIRTNNDLVVNNVVSKVANIYFDYSLPVTTNTAETVFATLSNAGFDLDQSISVYPNPTTSKINIQADTDIQMVSLYDVQGRVLQTVLGNQKVLDTVSQSNGIYFLKITTEKGSKVVKVVKQ